MTKRSSATLRNSVAVSALFVGMSAGMAAAQQAIADLEFGTLAATAYNTPTATADVGSILMQQSTNSVTGLTAGSTVDLSLTASTVTDTTYTGSYSETSNLFSAAASANITDSTVVYNFTPSTAGDTAVAGAYQGSTGDVTSTATSVSNTVNVTNAGIGAAVLSGTILVDNNDIASSGTANTANSSIALSSGVDVLEDASGAQASVAADATLASVLDSDNSADILVSSGQLASGMSVAATTSGSAVTVVVEEVDGATVTISNSDITASASGNTAAGAISSSDTTATITASTAVSNMQVLDIAGPDEVGATVVSADIILEVGREGLAGTETGTIDNSTLRITGNTIASSAEGNDSNQSISLVANAITGSGTADTVFDSTASGVKSIATADAVVANTQVVTAGAAISADTTSSSVLLRFNSDDLDMNNNTVEVTNNVISATARGADTSNSLSLQAGSTMSATGAVLNVQDDGGAVVTADVVASSIAINSDNSDNDFDDGTISNSSNSITASATGARANNDLAVASGTNNLSLDVNTGGVTILADPVATTDTLAPLATAGFVVTNEQGKSGGSVSATIDNNSDIDVALDNGSYDVLGVTINTDGNTISAQAVGATTDNLLSLEFNELAGSVTGGGDAVGIVANNQTLTGGATVTARAEDPDGSIIRTSVDDEIEDSTITSSSNRVSATVMGNQSTNNDIVVDATNVVITGGVDASPSTSMTGDTDLSATGAFVAASVQEIDTATLLASQNNVLGTSSNRVEIFADQLLSSTVVADANALSVLAVGNEAANGVSVGTATTSAVEASSVSANVQLIRAGNIDGEIGVLGSDPGASFVSTNSAPLQTTSIVVSGGGSDYTNNGSTVTYTFASTLTTAEQNALAAAGFQNITATTADFGAGTTLSTSGLVTMLYSNGPDTTPGTSDDTLAFSGFSGSGVAPDLNDAGVVVTRAASTADSSVSVTNNVIAGEIRGNVAANSTSVTGTTVTATSIATAGTDTIGADVAPTGASTVVTNVQSVDITSDLDMAVAGTFAIEDTGSPSSITDSQQNVDGNLQQSYATANRATNAITITATNSTADGVIENDQLNAASVDTSSDLDLMAAVGMTTSSTSIDGNRNQSVATGNIVSSTFTADATNVAELDGTASDGSVDLSTDISTGDAIIGNEQNNIGAITATATTDAFNEELNLAAGIDNIDNSTASISSNVTIAQATANDATLSSALGTAATANYDASGVTNSFQELAVGSVTASTDVEIDLLLTDDEQTVLSSTVTLDGNQAVATARGNVVTGDLSVAGTNIEAGTSGSDAVLGGEISSNTGAFVLATDQIASSLVEADSSSTRVTLDLTSSSVTDTDATLKTSTASVSSNRSTATATSNSADNTVAVGLVGSTSSLTATGGLYNDQTAVNATATGGMTVSADIDTSGTTVAPDTVNAVSGSQLSIDGNVSTASATGNTADNSISAVSTRITAGSANDADLDGLTLADAGYALLNTQVATGAVASTNTGNTVSALLSAEDTAVVSSTVSLSSNVVSSTATSNDAANSMSLGLAGTTSDLSSTGALVSVQTATGGTSATAGVSVVADVDSTDADATAISGSMLSVSDNSSVSNATANNVLNTFTAAGTNITAGGATDATATGLGVDAAYGVLNSQIATGTVTSTNTANSFTVDVDSADIAVANSTIDASSNTVEARASGNIAINNSMGLGGAGTASLSATGMVANTQSSSAVINASAASTVLVSLDTSDVAVNAASGSTIAVQNNSTTAMARGNVAQNVLNATSAAATGGDGDAGFAPSTLTAAYGVLNTQTNTNSVSGVVNGASYRVALNSGAPNATTAASGSTVTLSGNVADAVAYGNVATNSVSLASLNSATDDATAFVASIQSNAGAISASMTGNIAQVVADGSVPGSTVGVAGNAFRATAVGNFATSRVTRN